MTLRHLKIFVTVCKYNSITKASEALYISQPSVSVAIAELENHYNVSLFDRINKRLVITETGRQLYIEACQILSCFDSFENTANKFAQTDSLRLGTSITIGKYMVPHVAKWIKENFPTADLSIQINQSKEIELLVLSGQLDMALIEGVIFSDNLKVVDLTQDDLVAVCGNKFDVPDRITSADFRNLPLILREKGSGSRDYLEHSLLSRNIDVQPYIQSTSTQSIIHCVINNLGVTVLPYSLVRRYITGGLLRKLEIEDMELRRTYHAVMYKDKVLSPMQQQVLDYCLNFKLF